MNDLFHGKFQLYGAIILVISLLIVLEIMNR